MVTFFYVRNEVRSWQSRCVSLPEHARERIGEMMIGDVLSPFAVLGVVILVRIAFR
jgi:hypothetical protein